LGSAGERELSEKTWVIELGVHMPPSAELPKPKRSPDAEFKSCPFFLLVPVVHVIGSEHERNDDRRNSITAGLLLTPLI
jgi:hypothetical protein